MGLRNFSGFWTLITTSKTWSWPIFDISTWLRLRILNLTWLSHNCCQMAKFTFSILFTSPISRKQSSFPDDEPYLQEGRLHLAKWVTSFSRCQHLFTNFCSHDFPMFSLPFPMTSTSAPIFIQWKLALHLTLVVLNETSQNFHIWLDVSSMYLFVPYLLSFKSAQIVKFCLLPSHSFVLVCQTANYTENFFDQFFWRVNSLYSSAQKQLRSSLTHVFGS